MKLQKILTVYAAFCLALPFLLLSCGAGIQEINPLSKSITYFRIGNNEGQIDEVTGKITVFIPYSDANPNQIDSLSAEAEFNGESISPAPESPRSYKKPVTFTVFAKDQTKKEYQVTVEEGTPESNNIISFKLAGRTASVNWPNITATVPYNTNISRITPTVQHSGELYAPAGPQDFAEPVVYTVTSINGISKNYTVTVVIDPSPNKDIESFNIVGPLADTGEPAWVAIGAIDKEQSKITVTVPYDPSGNAQLEFTPEVLHTGISYDPEGPVKFGLAPSNTQKYTVTSAAGGSPHAYDVKVTMAASTDCSIAAFMIGGRLQTTIIEGASDQDGQINITVFYGTDLVNIAPIISHSGASYTPADPQDFSNSTTTPIKYTVTAHDPTITKDYYVSVTEAPSHFKAITSFKVGNFEADIEETDDENGDIRLTLPYGSSKTALSPTIVYSPLASISHDGTVTNGTINFTNSVNYTVAAPNGTSRKYVVTVTIAPNTAKQIKNFVISGQVLNTAINEAAGTITIEMPKYVDRAALTPTITFIGSLVSPASGAVNNFSSPQLYTVTAENGDTKTYTVTVNGTVVTPPISSDTAGYFATGGVYSGPNIYNVFDHDVRGYGYETFATWVQLVWDPSVGILPKDINRLRVYSTNGCLAGVWVTLFNGGTPSAPTPIPLASLPAATPPGTPRNANSAFYAAASNGNYAEINLDSSVAVTGVKVELKLRQGWGVFRILQVYLDQVD